MNMVPSENEMVVAWSARDPGFILLRSRRAISSSLTYSGSTARSWIDWLEKSISCCWEGYALGFEEQLKASSSSGVVQDLSKQIEEAQNETNKLFRKVEDYKQLLEIGESTISDLRNEILDYERALTHARKELGLLETTAETGKVGLLINIVEA